ncbi:MAG: helix-turn-helix transcriptional regulator [Clostridia bacterium]|nr:helix-turn-helix transcriptional regulator [Clostridia bacterium]MBR3715461.1 helix-turn-helix transcriptional regulator [Clostridia bacterium]
MIYNFDDLSLGILTVDRFFHENGTFKVKSRPYAALSFRERGVGTFKIGNKIFTTNPGDVIFIPADTPYEVDYSDSVSIVANLHFCNYCETEMFDLRARTEIALMFLRMLEEWQTWHSVNRAKASIFNILGKIAEYNDDKIENTAFFASVRYIEANFCKPDLNVKAVCGVGFVSPSSLQRLFLKHFGMSPKQYVIKLRMNKALELLIEGKLTVREISRSCGFEDEKYFSRAFKKKYGYPPSRLRDNTVV